MTDTPPFIYQKQFEIIFSKPKKERYLMGFEMMDTVRTIVVNSIKKQDPSISERDLWIAVFKRYYQNDFTPVQMNKIIQAFIAYSQDERLKNKQCLLFDADDSKKGSKI